MTSFDVASFRLYDEEHDRTVQCHNSNIWAGILFFYVYSWLNEMNVVAMEPCHTPGIYAKGYIVFVIPFVCNFVLFVELLQSFMFKQLVWSISHQPLIRKHSYLDHRSAFIPWLLTQGFIPRGGSKYRTPIKSVFLLILLWKQLMQIVSRTCLNHVTWTCFVMKWRSAWPILHGPVILSYILKPICCMYFILWENESVWLDVWPQN